jgi:hypothetical protein
MENFKFESNKESIKSLHLKTTMIQEALVGRSVEAGVNELIKIHAIVNQLIKQEVSNISEAGIIILDLFDEFDIKYFEPDMIFTKDLLTQIFKLKNPISLDFEINDTLITIETGSTVDSIMKSYNKNNDIKVEENLEDKEELKNEQEMADMLFSQLESLDFNNQELLMNWLCEYNEHIDYAGVISNKKAVLESFKLHGFSEVDNDKVDFFIAESLMDKNRYAKSMIGYMLANLGNFRSSLMKNWINKWKIEK